MAETKTFVADAPAWIDLSTSDPAAAKRFYGALFGWEIVDLGPDAGGYTMAKLAGKDVAGLGPVQDPNQPAAWAVYIGTHDADAVATKVADAGGTVVAAPFDVFDQGRMAVFQDPSGAFISVWQPKVMQGAEVMFQPGSYAWAELSSRGVDKATAFYARVFGWGEKRSPMGEGQGDYIEFLAGGQSVAGAMEMNPMVPKEVPSYWMVYFGVADVDGSHKKAVELGATEMLAPQDFAGGRFSILSDPQGATFGLLRMTQA